MDKWIVAKSVLVIGGASLLASGCVTREEVRYRHGPPPVVVEGSGPGEVVVSDAPPAPIVETAIPAPDPGFVWVGGVWVWQGGWVWNPGHWARPPHPGAIWFEPHYVRRGGRHVWVRGYWR
jgi:hypothetical protein